MRGYPRLFGLQTALLSSKFQHVSEDDLDNFCNGAYALLLEKKLADTNRYKGQGGPHHVSGI